MSYVLGPPSVLISTEVNHAGHHPSPPGQEAWTVQLTRTAFELFAHDFYRRDMKRAQRKTCVGGTQVFLGGGDLGERRPDDWGDRLSTDATGSGGGADFELVRIGRFSLRSALKMRMRSFGSQKKQKNSIIHLQSREQPVSVVFLDASP
jgi:hypothetical protein